MSNKKSTNEKKFISDLKKLNKEQKKLNKSLKNPKKADYDKVKKVAINVGNIYKKMKKKYHKGFFNPKRGIGEGSRYCIGDCVSDSDDEI